MPIRFQSATATQLTRRSRTRATYLLGFFALLAAIPSSLVSAGDPSVVSGVPVHSAALIKQAVDYTTGYVVGVDRTIDAGLAGTYKDWRPVAQKLCGATKDEWTGGCSAGVYDATRWQTSKLTYQGPDEWLGRYDDAVTGKQVDCGNGATPGSDGCQTGNKARK